MDIDPIRRIAARERRPAADASSSPEPDPAALELSHRGTRLQIVLRGVLVVFVLLTVTIVAPAHDSVASDVLAVAYALWSLGIGAWGWRGGPRPLQFGWLALFVDLAVLAALTLLAGASAVQSWTAYVLVSGFFLVPLLAATQLRPGVCTAVVAPTIAVYFLSSALTKTANAEPWDSILLRTFVLAALGAGCIALTWIQRARMTMIGRLLGDRTSLLRELIGTEDRERRALAEHLHDGALQYVLAARHDLEDARELADPAAFSRLDQALSESSRLLRSTVGELHPAVLEQAGLARALQELGDGTAAGAGIAVSVDLDGWSADLRTPADRLLYATARELLSNVVKHASAETARITLAYRDGRAELTIADDGIGIPDGALTSSLGRGHIGLASHRVRVEASGGRLHLARAQPSGTVARLELPVPAESLGAESLDR
ncbi:MAG: hypothetical protein JOY58_07980 [Solirubrobacterales bacterium]|nr:hypothetical protein [Solirubrobacterales bacterium]